MPSTVLLEPLTGGDPNLAPIGAHVVLEANGGAMLHVVRMPDGLVALRGGRVQHFQVARALPAASVVRYPPPFELLSAAEATQALERARGLVGLDAVELAARLESSGADAGELAAGGEAVVSECLCSFCTTGVSKWWRVAEAYRAGKQQAATVEAVSAPLGSPGSRVLADSAVALCAEGSPFQSRSADFSPLQTSSAGTSPKETASVETTETSAPRTQLSKTLQDKAIHTAAHVALRGPAAKIAGAAAAIGCEGYNLYQDVGGHSEQLENKNISKDQFQERVAESTIQSSGRAIGGLAGAAAGQAAIPIPLVGAVVGGVLGAAAGGMHASSFARGAFRLSGSKARGGDDLVRCIEHKPMNNSAQVAAPADLPAPAPTFAVAATSSAGRSGTSLGDEDGLL